MGSFSVWHWLILVAWVFLIVFPIGKIFSRLGIPWAVAFLMVVPGVNLVMLWIVAFIKWPRDHVPPQG
ncbi:hypothetical protein [Phenylobacterium sp.]|uniref:hypothetical protein n=1 Tax=Phenylobacterium sp. TaxID=1871053 RepID=UPI00272F6CBB|nr:hypothetical protein [Phenylobacterium sp.]MDP1616207.1 hypothetical protein [Phenylobacterium sp.]MDP1988760.1 hypothetical protein [Phenylobacterium sp.]